MSPKLIERIQKAEDDINKVADEIANEGMTYRAARVRRGAIMLAEIRAIDRIRAIGQGALK
ncbi:hypothetical protein [Bradyrhizobium sp. 87]|uniref:hypothetical protein n=1 Tax=Bradyrhizobium sp. 87 TaxID=2782682 RepID=UPI001FFA56F8|nr:hypothetical protein [Bradyrhizobium sp. 87]MCK1430921.1 hypothetical protein [Bradyrhizobium sp. 87]